MHTARALVGYYVATNKKDASLTFSAIKKECQWITCGEYGSMNNAK